MSRNDHEIITSLLERYQNYTDTKINVSDVRPTTTYYHLLFVDFAEHRKETVDKIKSIVSRNSETLVVAVLPERVNIKGVSIAHYVVKPIDDGYFFSAMDVLLSQILMSHYFLGSNQQLISADEIVYGVCDGRKIRFEMVDCTIYSNETFSYWTECFAKSSIVACKRGYFVNLKYVRAIDRTIILLGNGVSIPVSRRKRDSVINRYRVYQR